MKKSAVPHSKSFQPSRSAKAKLKDIDDYERASQRVIDGLNPEIQRHVCKIDGSYRIHCPLLITFGLTGHSAESINAAYMHKNAIGEKFLANIRFDPLASLVLIEKPYRLDAFLEIQDRLSDAQYWRNLEFVFSMTEYVHESKTKWLSLLQSNQRYRPLMMTRKDRKAFENLPDTLTIYRGYQHGKYRHKMGLSWTLSKEKAIWFAHRRSTNGSPKVVVGTCKKADVFCYTDDRNEQEIIIDPAKVIGIRAVRDIGPSPFGLESCSLRSNLAPEEEGHVR